MPTVVTGRSETRSISIAAPLAAVLTLVGDPLRLPEWAPRFARGVTPDGDGWLVDSGESELRILVPVSADRGTVDMVSAKDPALGAFTRVLPNNEGSEYLFTLFFPPGADGAAIDRQMLVVEQELRTVRDLVEASV